MTANSLPASADQKEAFCTSGTSPTVRSATLHLVGPGQVGRAFLRLLPDTPFRLIGITDTSATLHARDGLDPLALADHKAAGGRLASLRGAESLPVDLALDFVGADVVVDATATDVRHAAAAVRRAEGILRRGGSLALAAKSALCAAGAALLAGPRRQRVGIHAVLGGTGAALVRELDGLRADATGVQLVGNASTTVVIEHVERGGSLADGIAAAQRAGVLEPDPELDLSGRDAATKLAAVAGVLWRRTVAPEAVRCEHLRSLSADELRRRARRGLTTRLVASATPDGDLSVGYRALPRTAALAVPGDRVAYAYALRDGSTRVHVGHGIGPVRTAEALLYDVQALSHERNRQRAAGGVR